MFLIRALINSQEALEKYRKDIKFSWSGKEKEAMTIFENGDTLLLHIGGCDHFISSATLLSSISFDDTKTLKEKSKWLAKTSAVLLQAFVNIL